LKGKAVSFGIRDTGVGLKILSEGHMTSLAPFSKALKKRGHTDPRAAASTWLSVSLACIYNNHTLGDPQPKPKNQSPMYLI
jgi:hypothetical protein